VGTTTTTTKATKTTTTTQADPAMKIGVISYWGDRGAYYDTLPDGSLALINPESGILSGQSLEKVCSWISGYYTIVKKAVDRGIKLLAYVPTGYFNHGCNVGGKCQTLERIEKQIAKYFEIFPSISGIFFDETAPAHWSCAAFVDEYEKLRQLLRKYSSTATIAWNPGFPTYCAVNGAKKGEIIALYEKDGKNYIDGKEHGELSATATSAHSKGIEVWHLAYKVSAEQMQPVIEKARSYNVDWFYATDIGGNWQAGENTWGSPPAYWDELKRHFQ
jgi:hypothetical protein